MGNSLGRISLETIGNLNSANLINQPKENCSQIANKYIANYITHYKESEKFGDT